MWYKIKISCITLIFMSLYAHAQKKQTYSSTWNPTIEIDGNHSEWGDSLAYYYEKQDLHYSFANDDEYLYVAMKVKDINKQTQATFNGFSVTINPKNKKREEIKLTFPIPDRAALRALNSQEFDKPTDLRETALSAIRGLYIDGFPGILSGAISLENNYGIKAKVQIDSTDHLIYECAIQLKQLNLHPKQQTIAVNVKINGLIKTQYTTYDDNNRYNRNPYGYGYGGYNPYGRQGRTVIGSKEEPGVWQDVQLAKKPNSL